jgi:polyisoprenoid-binding protein YceI
MAPRLLISQSSPKEGDQDKEKPNMSTQSWAIDSSHSGIHFSVRHMVIAKVRGQFSRWTGVITMPEGDLGRAKVEVTIDASSIDTGVADRDTHLRSADFLDVATYPEATFKSERVEALSADRLQVTGALSLHGVTREVTLDVESFGKTKDPWGNDRIGFSARTALQRSEFGLTWNQTLETGGVLVSDRVELEFEIEAVKQVESKVA